MFLSLIRGVIPDLIDATVIAAWRPIDDIAGEHPVGQATVTEALQPQCLNFVLSHIAVNADGVLACHKIDMPIGGAILRVDEVCFPVGAIAHRHVHSGSGIRHLTRGTLRLEADNHTAVMKPGESWFEAINSPVRAVALQDTGVTSFARCMVVPLADLGRSTFQLMDDADADLPRLQMTHRHIDHPL